MNRVLMVSVAITMTGVLFGPAAAQQRQGQANREAEIKELDQELERYVAAFNNHDADALAQQWARRGDIITSSGKKIEGRDAIRAFYAEKFEQNKDIRANVALESRRFMGGGRWVLEDGTFEFLHATGSGVPAKGRFVAILNKPRQGDRRDMWVLVSLRTMVPAEASEN